MTKLKISSRLSLPVEVATEPMAIFARTGRGKTYTASVLAEEMLTAGIQIAVVDPQGGWWGLRSSATGKGEGFPVVIFGGEHADVPLEPTGGKLAADLVVHEGISAIFDLSLFESRADEIRFMTDFADRLFRAKRRGTNLLHVFIDEASVFAPQNVRGDTAKMVGAVEAIAKRGRIKGLRCTCIDQRPASVNKNVINQAAGLFVMGLPSSQDRKAIKEWVTAKGEDEAKLAMLEELASLPVGSGWLWWPDRDIFQRVDIRKRKTFDSSATPEVGVVATEPKVLAKVDLEAVSKKMAATIERAKAEDPKELRKQLAQLRKELAQRPTETTVETKEVPVEVHVFKDHEVARLEGAIDKLSDVGGNLVAVAREISDALTSVSKRPPPAPARPAPVRSQPRPQRQAPTREAPVEMDGDVSLRRGERKMLEVLARHHPMRVTRAQLATLAGFAVRGGTFGTYFGVLKRAGFIEERGNETEITEAGFDYLGEAIPPQPQTTEEVLDIWRRALRAGERAMLDELVASFPDSLTREELADRTGFTVSGGTFGTYLGVLRRNGLIEVQGGDVVASETLFLSGAPR